MQSFFFPFFVVLMVSCAGRILKVFAPNLLKLSLIENKMASMAVSIPTRQVIPTAIISNVKTDLKRLFL